MIIIYILTILTIITFFVAVISKIIRIASAPVHLRWELYPVPHEGGGKASYGGSRLEEPDWWEKKIHKDSLGELKVMVPEIVFLKGVWEHNKQLWLGSYPFHFALYLFIVNIALFSLVTFLKLVGYDILFSGNVFGQIINYAIYIFAWTGSILGLIGTLRLLFSRTIDPNLSKYSSASHYFNIIFIGSLYFTVFLWLISGRNFVADLSNFYYGLVTFSTAVQLPTVAYWHIILSLLFIAYLPFTHMSHFFTKYFTYHQVRWEDEPNIPSSKLNKKLLEQLNYPVSWAAPHIGADGTKSWLAIATEIPHKEK